MPVRRRPSKTTRAVAGYTAGCVALVVGVGLQWGLAAALMFGGVLVAVSFLVLGDVGGD